ncbi:MAG: FAD-dependent thymidylate synthase [Hydrogenobacter thermophilus]|uniref:FAD-dependent thymidylate synthase n=1 Tax=Hydrogenobacter thermophilus TaxID=940 RepID=UPI001C75A1F9|nr:FAD-dependent thymidylate synthase [Hydrogenobacter thermophilus]QWK18898.1 MAG: FAD-dependent thymidylate synthase [Hydrogenobacter thermophilus]
MKVHIMGSDQRIVRCARVSFAKDAEVDKERDKKLIKYLFENKHASPFEHVIIAFEGEKSLWLELIEKVSSPVFQLYWAEGYIYLNLRNFINAFEHIPQEVKEEVKKRLPATYAIIEGGETESYSLDSSYVIKKIETSSGWIGLVDRLELGTSMDYYTFVVECPLFVARQWHRHRFGSYNEVSRRYVSFEPTFYIPKYLRKQSLKNRQASMEEQVEEPWNSLFLKKIKFYMDDLLTLYKNMLEKAVARELARGVLPQFMHTRFYWTVPRISLDNFISLRRHESAQKEIREFAQALVELVGYRKSYNLRL